MDTPCWLRLETPLHHRVWGGKQFSTDPNHPIGEAWIVHEHNRVLEGPWAGLTLAQVATQAGAGLLGSAGLAGGGLRFPLLIKLLDCADWLSVQVHPNDQQAQRLAGPGQLGKTEAWHILQADPQARVIAGVKPGTSATQLAQAIRQGSILDWAQTHPVVAGDTVMMPAGTLHALGPGLLLYEVQQSSDITYRVYDWNRPASAGRTLHLEESVAVTDPQAHGQVIHLPQLAPTDQRELVRCPYFVLEVLQSDHPPLEGHPRQLSFHILTLTQGRARLDCQGQSLMLEPFSTVVIPAQVDHYQLTPQPQFSALRAWVPPSG